MSTSRKKKPLTEVEQTFLALLPAVTGRPNASVSALKLRGYVRYENAGAHGGSDDETIVVLTQEGALAIHPDPACEWHKGGFCGGCKEPT